MGILTIVFGSRGAAVPYLEIMEQLSQDGVDCLTYVTDDVRSYAATINTPTIVDRFNASIFTAGSAMYQSAENTLALLMAARHLTRAASASAMQTISAAVESGQFVPSETVVVITSTGLLSLGHYLLELGVKSFICLEAYRTLDWKGIWQQDGSQFAPGGLPRSLVTPLFRIPFAPIGKQNAEEHFGRSIPYDFESIKAAVTDQLHMYSPQLTEDKHLAYGYPYPQESRPMPLDVAELC